MAQPRREWVDLKELRPGPIRHASLSDELLTKIRRIHSVFVEVDGTTLEERETLLQRDVHPEIEVATWERMADAFERFCGSRELSRDAIRDVYGLLLMHSMTSAAEALKRVERKVLSEEDAREVLAGFH